MNVVVSGSRTITDTEFIESKLSELFGSLKFDTLLVGCARGVDTIAKDWAIKNKVEFSFFRADWKRYGPKAGPMRNQEMVEQADMLIAFCTNKESRGTESTIRMARKKNIPSVVYYIKD